ncbi:MAG: NAD(P)/FAD-dependent oxidoreductase [Pseudonocardia sp.]
MTDGQHEGQQPHRVVIVGGGFGGLNVTRALARAEDVHVTLIDRTNHHLFQPLLYQVAAGILPPGLIAPALRGVISTQRNARAVLADVHDLDLDARVVRAAGPDGRVLEFPYDTLVVASGATHSYFGNDEFAEYAPGMKTIEDARTLRNHILSAFEMAELSQDPQERAEWLTFVVIGAGPTGVELVGQVAELAHKVLPRDYRSVDTREARILLLEGAPAVLPPFAPKLQRWTHQRLERMGVEIRVNTLAVGMDDESLTMKGPDGEETIRTRTRIWAAGVAASPLARLLAERTGATTDRAGRVAVNPDCTLPGHPEVFAIGDMVSLNGLPGVAQPAMQEGRYVGDLIRARLAGDRRHDPFRYLDKGSMATIGYRAAVADAFGAKLTGLTAYAIWAFIHVFYLIGWGNRLGTLYTWARAMVFSTNRGHRIITFEQAKDQAVPHHDRRPPDRPSEVAPPPPAALPAAPPPPAAPLPPPPAADHRASAARDTG